MDKSNRKKDAKASSSKIKKQTKGKSDSEASPFGSDSETNKGKRKASALKSTTSTSPEELEYSSNTKSDSHVNKKQKKTFLPHAATTTERVAISSDPEISTAPDTLATSGGVSGDEILAELGLMGIDTSGSVISSASLMSLSAHSNGPGTSERGDAAVGYSGGLLGIGSNFNTGSGTENSRGDGSTVQVMGPPSSVPPGGSIVNAMSSTFGMPLGVNDQRGIMDIAASLKQEISSSGGSGGVGGTGGIGGTGGGSFQVPFPPSQGGAVVDGNASNRSGASSVNSVQIAENQQKINAALLKVKKYGILSVNVKTALIKRLTRTKKFFTTLCRRGAVLKLRAKNIALCMEKHKAANSKLFYLRVWSGVVCGTDKRIVL